MLAHDRAIPKSLSAFVIQDEKEELTEQVESTLTELQERERNRADKVEECAEKLEAELRETRKPWWRRMFAVD